MTGSRLPTGAVIDPFSGVHLPILWVVYLVAFLVFGLAVAYLIWRRRNTYDDRLAWNYAVGIAATGLLSAASAILLLNAIFNALRNI